MLTTILQPAFFPWLGYFDMINKSDNFVFYDDVQITKWFTNRNKISSGWIIVSVKSYDTPINKTLIDNDKKWKAAHLNKIYEAYHKHEFYKETMSLIERIYEKDFYVIDELAIATVEAVCDHIGIKGKFSKSSELNIHSDNKTQRLVDICKHFGADTYMTGMAALKYLEKDRFGDITIKVHGYRGEKISIIDTLMNKGKSCYEQISNEK